MENCLKAVNNIVDLFTSCKSKDTNNSAAVNNSNDNSSYKSQTMNKYILQLPTTPKVGDDIIIKAKLNENPKELIIQLGVDSTLDRDNGEPAMIAFHFRTKFIDDTNSKSYVEFKCKRGPNDWGDAEKIENWWIDDDAEEFDLRLNFTKTQIHVFSQDSNHYQFDHQFEIERINSFEVKGDLKYIKEVTLSYAQ